MDLNLLLESLADINLLNSRLAFVYILFIHLSFFIIIPLWELQLLNVVHWQLCVLGNLCPETVEEAIAMVPSIKVPNLPSILLVFMVNCRNKTYGFPSVNCVFLLVFSP